MKKKIVLWILLIIWLYVIYFFSSQNGSASESTSSIIYNIVKTYIPNINVLIVRKLAHFIEFSVLGIIITLLYKEYKCITNKGFILIFLLRIIFASFDELHQLFINERAGKITDVVIDSMGSFFGIICTLFFKKKY